MRAKKEKILKGHSMNGHETIRRIRNNKTATPKITETTSFCSCSTSHWNRGFLSPPISGLLCAHTSQSAFESSFPASQSDHHTRSIVTVFGHLSRKIDHVSRALIRSLRLLDNVHNLLIV